MIEDPNLVQWIIGQVGIGGLATFMLITLNANYKTALQREKEYAEANREDKRLLLDTLRENTAALSKLTAVIDALAGSYERTHNR